jgi:DNA-binding NarL/FixJ family response regulator
MAKRPTGAEAEQSAAGPIPRHLRARRVSWGEDELCVFSFPLPSRAAAVKLTPAEQAVMRLALAGHSNASIAARRGVAARTVANQLASVFQKLGVSSRTELAGSVSRRCGR